MRHQIKAVEFFRHKPLIAEPTLSSVDSEMYKWGRAAAVSQQHAIV